MSEAKPGALLTEARTVARTARQEIARCADLESLVRTKARYVGKQGELKAFLKRIVSVPTAERPATGAEINRLADEVEAALEARRAELDAAAADGPPDTTFDPTLP